MHTLNCPLMAHEYDGKTNELKADSSHLTREKL